MRRLGRAAWTAALLLSRGCEHVRARLGDARGGRRGEALAARNSSIEVTAPEEGALVLTSTSVRFRSLLTPIPVNVWGGSSWGVETG